MYIYNLNKTTNKFTNIVTSSVGCTIITVSGEFITGANVENASYGAGICAERTAIVKAVVCYQFIFILCERILVFLLSTILTYKIE